MKKFLTLGLVLSSMSFLASCGQKYYTITWENDDHTVLSKTKVAENSMPEYDKGTPTKPSTDEFEYTFTGWTPEIVKATEDATYVASYTSATRSYEIVFDADGGYFDGDPSKTKISMTLPYGSPVEFTKEPVKPNTARYSYSFKGWDKEITSVKGPATYKAVYDDEEHPCVTMNYQYNSSGNTVTVDFTGDSKFWIDWGDQPEVDKHNKSHTYTNGNHTIKIYGGLTSFKLPSSSGREYITSINIAHSVTSIPEDAFWNCFKLSSISLPSSLKTIGGYAFQSNYELTSVFIPEGVTSVGKHAFESCSKLSSVSFPSTVTSIGENLFYQARDVSNIIVAEGNKKFDSRNNCKAIIETATNKLLYGCKGTVIPNTVKTIAEEAFWNQNITSFSIPNGVTTIEDRAFYGCHKPTSLTIPESVNHIGNEAFGDCQGLNSITVSSNNTYYDSRNSCNAIVEKATDKIVAACTNSTIENGIKEIGDSAFAYTDITSATFPTSLKVIGKDAFQSCKQLASLSFNSDIESIGEGAFLDCTAITSISITGSSKYDTRDNCNAIIETATNTLLCACNNSTIPNTVTKIGANAFWGCSGITTLNVPESVKEIEFGAFQGCTGLTSLSLPGVETLGGYLFNHCSVKTLNLGASLKSVDSAALSAADLETVTIDSNNTVYDSRNSCNAIVETATNTIVCGCNKSTIPNSVTAIGYFAFGNCHKLESVDLSSITSIGDSAFASCASLTSVTLPSTLNSIPSSAFSNCSKLTSIVIPNSITSIGEGAFSGCSSLTTVDMSNVDHLISGGKSMFSTCKLYADGIILDHELEPQYRADQYWAPYAQYFRQPE